MVLVIAIFFTIILTIVMSLVFYTVVNMIPFLKNKWNNDSKMEVINFLFIITLFYASIIFSLIRIWIKI